MVAVVLQIQSTLVDTTEVLITTSVSKVEKQDTPKQFMKQFCSINVPTTGAVSGFTKVIIFKLDIDILLNAIAPHENGTTRLFLAKEMVQLFVKAERLQVSQGKLRMS